MNVFIAVTIGACFGCVLGFGVAFLLCRYALEEYENDEN